MGPRGNPVASRLVREADVILALGTRLGFNSTFYSYDNINREAAIIQVELEPTAIGRFFPVKLGIWADAPTAAAQLTDAVKALGDRAAADSWVSDFQAERRTYLEQRDAAADMGHPTQPSGLFKALRGVLPQDAAITMDAGTLCLQATDALNYCALQPVHPAGLRAGRLLLRRRSGDQGSLPERPVVSFMGDGGFGMTVSELSTAVEYGLNTVTVVMNNGSWGAEKAYQRDFFGERYIGADITSPDFAALAELYGAAGYRADRLSDVAGAVEAALAEDRPAVVEVAVDPKALYSFRRDSFKHRGG